MIYDDLSNLNSYVKLEPTVLQLVTDFIASVNSASEAGRRNLDGDMVMADLSFYKSAPACEGRIEDHKRYIDIQVVLEGHELIYMSSCEGLELLEDRYDNGDIGFYAPNLEIAYAIPMTKGKFMVIMPNEGHMPGRGDDACDICKIVFKIDKSLWGC